MSDNYPPRPPKSARIVITLDRSQKRLDNVLLQALRDQEDYSKLKALSRAAFKELFNEGKIQIKGQNARPSSALAAGTTYVDILGF
jgi:ribosomal 50S subunit-recycling heat shock protein